MFAASTIRPLRYADKRPRHQRSERSRRGVCERDHEIGAHRPERKLGRAGHVQVCGDQPADLERTKHDDQQAARCARWQWAVQPFDTIIQEETGTTGSDPQRAAIVEANFVAECRTSYLANLVPPRLHRSKTVNFGRKILCCEPNAAHIRFAG